MPRPQQELLEHEIDLLLLDLKEVEKLLSDASLEGSPQSMAQGPLRFFRKIMERRLVLETLLARLLELEGPLSDLGLGAPPPAPILTILKEGFRMWVEQGPLAEEFNERAEKLLRSDFFHPDTWLRNADDVMPVLGVSTRLRPSVRVRLREI